MRRSSKRTENYGDTQWTGRLVTLACKHGFRDLVRLGVAGDGVEAEFNRISEGRKMRAWLPGEAPGDFAFWLVDEKPWGMPEALKLAHYAASRALMIVCHSAWATFEWWQDELAGLFTITEMEETGGHIVIMAAPMSLVGEIKSKGAVPHDVRRHQMRVNCRYYRNWLTPKDFTGNSMPPHDQKAVLVCAGPSLRSTWPQIKMGIEASRGADLIVSCSMSYRFLMDRGIRPDVHVEVDPRPHKVHQILPIEPGTQFWLASDIALEWQDHVREGDVRLWHSHNGPESEQSMNEIDPGRGAIAGGGSIGLRAICCLYFKGFRRLDIHGMDCSFDDQGEQHAGTHLGKPMPEIDITVGKRKFRTSPVMVTYARYFGTLLPLIPDMEISLAGDGLLQAMYGKRE